MVRHPSSSPAAQAVDGEQQAHPGVVAGEHLRPQGHVQRARLALPRPARAAWVRDQPPHAAQCCRMARLAGCRGSRRPQVHSSCVRTAPSPIAQRDQYRIKRMIRSPLKPGGQNRKPGVLRVLYVCTKHAAVHRPWPPHPGRFPAARLSSAGLLSGLQGRESGRCLTAADLFHVSSMRYLVHWTSAARSSVGVTPCGRHQSTTHGSARRGDASGDPTPAP